jgi:hypothetical protein
MSCDDDRPQHRTERADGVVTTAGVRLNDEEKGQIDESRVVLEVIQSGTDGKNRIRRLWLSCQPGRLIAFASFQTLIWGMSGYCLTRP